MLTDNYMLSHALTSPKPSAPSEFALLRMATRWLNSNTSGPPRTNGRSRWKLPDSHTDALFSLRSSILRKMAYPLAVTTFMEQQCTELMKPILGVGLPKIGCIWSMPRAVVHGPIDRAGLNIPNLYTEQAVTQLVMLLHFGSCSGDQMGVLLRALTELMKLETGLVSEPLTTPGIFAPLVTDMWLK